MEGSWMVGMEELANFWTDEAEGRFLKNGVQARLEDTLILHIHELLNIPAAAETTWLESKHCK